jgi:hypothetical protein
MKSVSLRDIVEALDLQSDELHSCLDPSSGEITTFNDEEIIIVQRGNWQSAPAWMQEQLPKIKRALEDDRILALPDRAHIDEWRMMQHFVVEEEQCRCRSELESAVHGEDAFRRFRDATRRLGLEDKWLRYREVEYERVAREWLEENNIPYH